MAASTTTPAPAQAAVPHGPTAGREASIASWLLVGVLLVCAYAAFWHGATDMPAETRLEVALGVLALVALVGWVGAAAPPPQLAPRVLLALGLLTGFAVWSGLSLIWSVAPAGTWVELNRWIAYLAIVAVTIAAASRLPAALERIAVGWLAVAGAVACWALAGKVAPWISLGPLDFNHTAIFSRLRAPLGYWNALGLVCVLGAPLALRIATDTSRRLAVRVGALRLLVVLLVALGLTYSRGGVIALVVGVGATLWLGGPRLRALAATGLALAAAVPPLVCDFASHALTSDNQSVGQRVLPGLVFGAVLVASVYLAGWVAAELADRESRSNWPPERSALLARRLGRGALAAGALAIVVLAATGTITNQVHSFTATRSLAVSDPARLLSSNSGNRWVWWKEATGAFSAKPLGGWGAGSFPVTHLLYREPPPLPVNQPHSVPLQLLAETGLVGFVLAFGAFAALLLAAFERVRRLPVGRARDLAGACAAAGLAWLVHGLVDWDTDIPGVTLPALMLLAAAATAQVGPRQARHGRIWPPRGVPLTVGVATIATAAIAASAILPAWSQSKAQGALSAAAAARRPADLQHAQAQAELAARLNPLAVQPLLYAAAIAQRRGLAQQARSDLLRAVDRQPDYPATWYRLIQLTIALNDRIGSVKAAQRLLEIDPVDPLARYYASFAQLVAALPEDSATAIGTPLGGPAAQLTPPQF